MEKVTSVNTMIPCYETDRMQTAHLNFRVRKIELFPKGYNEI